MVDDDTVTTSLYAHIFRDWGHAAATCSSYEEAMNSLAAAGPYAFDVLITDHVLMDWNGRTGADLAVHAARQFPAMEIIIASGCLDHIDLPASLKNGRAKLLSKPWEPKRLQEMLREAPSVQP